MRIEVSVSRLFPEPSQARTRPLGGTEPAVHWFTESTRPQAVASREVVDGWYQDFPDPESKLATNLRSEVDVTHNQALDELYVHHLLRQQFDDVRYEEGGTGPDFRVYGDGACVAGIEVLSLFQRQDWTAEERRHSRLADALNARVPPTAGYFVDFEIEQSDRQPAPRRFADFVARQLAQFPPHDQVRLPPGPTREDLQSAVYKQDGVRVRVWFRPMKADASTKSDPNGRIAGIGPVSGGWVNSWNRLKDRVAAKAGNRYEIADIPFLVVAAIHDIFCSDDQVLEGLYGGESVIVPSLETVQRNDGLFGMDKGRPEGRHRRVSAVAVVRGLRVWEPDTADVAVLHNPHATRPWMDYALPASRRFGPVDTDGQSVKFDWI
jgi:hypothetical protein